MAYEDILFEVEGGIATITFNRPEVLNALKMGTLTEVGEAIKTIADDEEVRALILTGAGDRAFVAGADIKELQKLNPVSAKHFAVKGIRHAGRCGHACSFRRQWPSRTGCPPPLPLRRTAHGAASP